MLCSPVVLRSHLQPLVLQPDAGKSAPNSQRAGRSFAEEKQRMASLKPQCGVLAVQDPSAAVLSNSLLWCAVMPLHRDAGAGQDVSRVIRQRVPPGSQGNWLNDCKDT